MKQVYLRRVSTFYTVFRASVAVFALLYAVQAEEKKVTPAVTSIDSIFDNALHASLSEFKEKVALYATNAPGRSNKRIVQDIHVEAEIVCSFWRSTKSAHTPEYMNQIRPLVLKDFDTAIEKLRWVETQPALHSDFTNALGRIRLARKTIAQ